jgi:catechol 2,3-dioxygenase-like lactoylglutathione lyase family enzyme
MQNPGQPTQAIDLDHVGFIVQDLSAARDLFVDLGFVLTERADHTRSDAQGLTVSAGSSQHSIMLEVGYIELMQITDARAGHQLTPATGERYGLHVLALGCADARAWHARCLQNALSALCVF